MDWEDSRSSPGLEGKPHEYSRKGYHGLLRSLIHSSIYLLIAMDVPKWVIKSIDKFFEKEGKKQMEVVVLLLGRR